MFRQKAVIFLTVIWLVALFTGCSAEPQSTPVIATQPSSKAPTIPAPTVSIPPASVPQETQPEEKYVICIDAGHQKTAIWETEPNGPGSDVMKAKLSSGTQGVVTKVPEYQLNLEVSLLLEQALIARGYEVIMIRRTNDCPLSNAERAQIANESGADLFIRIHANGSEDPSVSGMLCCAPSRANPYLTEQVITESIRLSDILTKAFCAATGANNQGIYYVDTMTGINWCKIPVTIVEMGYMSNPAEDEAMATAEYRAKMVEGMADGIDGYFGRMSENAA